MVEGCGSPGRSACVQDDGVGTGQWVVREDVSGPINSYMKGWLLARDDGVMVMKQQPLGLQNVGVVMNGLTMDRYERTNHISCKTGSPQRTMSRTGLVGVEPVVHKTNRRR